MSISSTTTRNDCIMVAMKRSEAMIRSYAQTHDLEFEDLYQDIAELMLHVWERMPADIESNLARALVTAVCSIRCNKTGRSHVL